jgi:hypothetical protein
MAEISLVGRERILETSRYEERVLMPGVGFGGEGGDGALGREERDAVGCGGREGDESFDGAGTGRWREAIFGAYASRRADMFGSPSLGVCQ